MPSDEKLTARSRAHFGKSADITEKRMFGGVAFMFRGNMCVGVVDDMLMARLGKARVDTALSEAHVLPMDFTGRPLSTMIYVEADGIADDEALGYWIDEARAFVRTLPAK